MRGPCQFKIEKERHTALKALAKVEGVALAELCDMAIIDYRETLEASFTASGRYQFECLVSPADGPKQTYWIRDEILLVCQELATIGKVSANRIIYTSLCKYLEKKARMTEGQLLFN